MTSPSWESTSTGLRRWLPILQWLPQYNRSWLRVDVIAGLTVVALIVPDGMAYAQLAGMPPETALYGAWIALVIAIKQVPKRFRAVFRLVTKVSVKRGCTLRPAL